MEKLTAEIEQRYGKEAKEDFEKGYKMSMSFLLDNAKRGIEERAAIQDADRIDTKITNTEYEDDLKRHGMM